jgi:thiamine-phosphate pyrophosphorylase
MERFELIVISLPLFFRGEAECLDALLASGLSKLHIRKPGASKKELDGLLREIRPRWRKQLVLHGGNQPGEVRELANKYEIGQIHCPQKVWNERWGLRLSSSLHSWEEMATVDERFAYVFISPLFNSISKEGYMANESLLQRPAVPQPCKVIGLGGIDCDTIREVLRHGWDGAAVMGWIWGEAGKEVQRFEDLQKIIEGYS